MANRTKRTEERVSRFLEALREGWSISRACKSVGVGRTTVHEWRDDPAFRKAMDDAYESGTDRLEDVALQRAVDGSDALLTLLLRSRRPERYRERFEAMVATVQMVVRAPPVAASVGEWVEMHAPKTIIDATTVEKKLN